ncbi:hypothetical protein CBU02nite_32410 [Clostridium butyricum]|uniref:Helix-turn-helix domain-containing protein n=1 Tax=Clostridium butyricum TaxID=1492 RepID=A0A512TRA5_CLOBU|nr:helix-turn-helix domain-containing protein [Clostridium butyricum]NOW22120.1 hypothetical protein [Clostridium butyricum]GEQ22735.1 hypothetical protein CBU02nite_32410 [Clostridium butyricum]
MNKLIGVRWGMLEKETQDWLLEKANCIDGITGNNTTEGDCIIDLTDELSVSGQIKCINKDEGDYEYIIDDEAIIYSGEVLLESKENVEFEINNVLTASEAAEMWGITEGAIRKAIASRRLVPGVDFRKAGRITLITKEAMVRFYGKLY